MNLPLNQTLLTFLFYVRQTWITRLILGNHSVRGYLPLIQKDSVTHINYLEAYVRSGLPFARDVSLKNSVDSY